jgi:D-alanyl-D-alanine carboxypeptidase
MPIPNDIPVAQRITDPSRSPENATTKTNPVQRSLQSVPWWAYGLAVLAFSAPIASTHIWFSLNANANNQLSNQSSQNATPIAEISQPVISPAKPPTTSFITKNPAVIASPEAIAKEPDHPAELFGHYGFAEAAPNKLRTIGRAGDGYEIKLHQSAAKSYLKMEADAKADGIEFVVISGFRTIAEQQELFFDISKQRNQTPAQRAKVSAPPGHSEHHTGYALDIGDSDLPSANLSTSFEKTAAFQWLQNNGAKYGFEMSFPPNNSQGVMYEPWHWRFVGDDESLATFYKKSSRNSSLIKKP